MKSKIIESQLRTKFKDEKGTVSITDGQFNPEYVLWLEDNLLRMKSSMERIARLPTSEDSMLLNEIAVNTMYAFECQKDKGNFIELEGP